MKTKDVKQRCYNGLCCFIVVLSSITLFGCETEQENVVNESNQMEGYAKDYAKTQLELSFKEQSQEDN